MDALLTSRKILRVFIIIPIIFIATEQIIYSQINIKILKNIINERNATVPSLTTLLCIQLDRIQHLVERALGLYNIPMEMEMENLLFCTVYIEFTLHL